MSTSDRDDQGAAPVREDGATFAVTRIRSGRRPRALAVGVLLAIGGLVGIGLVDGEPGPGVPAGPEVVRQAGATAAPLATAIRREGVAGPRSSNRPRPVGPLIAGIMDLDLRPAGSHLFVHGDVYALDVIRVVVSVEDGAGNVAASRTITLPSGSTAFRLGANGRFDTQFHVPDELMGEGLWVRANAYDVRGSVLAELHEPIVAPKLEAA